jgi:xanthine dehydrogenase YagR molybdenum-binding subunit
MREQAIKLAVEDAKSPLHGVDPDTVVVSADRLHVKGNPARGETYRQVLTRNNRTRLETMGSFTRPMGPERFSLFAYGAVLVGV